MSNHTLRRIVLATMTAVGLSACGGSQSDPGVNPDNAPAILKVENQSQETMTIFVLRSGTRMRLGTVNPGSTQTFQMARTLYLGAPRIRIVADPLGRTRNSVSEEFDVRPGEEIVMRILPT